MNSFDVMSAWTDPPPLFKRVRKLFCPSLNKEGTLHFCVQVLLSILRSHTYKPSKRQKYNSNWSGWASGWSPRGRSPWSSCSSWGPAAWCTYAASYKTIPAWLTTDYGVDGEGWRRDSQRSRSHRTFTPLPSLLSLLGGAASVPAPRIVS